MEEPRLTEVDGEISRPHVPHFSLSSNRAICGVRVSDEKGTDPLATVELFEEGSGGLPRCDVGDTCDVRDLEEGADSMRAVKYIHGDLR